MTDPSLNGFPPPTDPYNAGQPAAPAPVPPAPVAAAPTYPEGYTPYVAHGVDLSAHGTVFLDVPGAAVPVYVARADTNRPQLYIGMNKGKPSSFSTKIKTPLLGGGWASISWKEPWLGFPTASLEGRTLFSMAKPPGWDRFVIVIVRIVPLVIGLIPGYFIGNALARWVGGMVKQGKSTASRRLVPLAVVLGPILALAGLILVAVLTADPATTR